MKRAGRSVRWWPTRLRGQMIAVVLIGLALAQIAGLVIYRSKQQSELQALHDEFVIRRITTVARLIQQSPAELHGLIVRSTSSRAWQFRLSAQPLTALGDSGIARAHWLQTRMANRLNLQTEGVHVALKPRLSRYFDHDDHDDDDDDDNRRQRRPRSHHDHSDDDDRHQREKREVFSTIRVSLALKDDLWLTAIYRSDPLPPFWQWPTVLTVTMAALILSLLMILMVRRITQPLANLANVAELVGRGEQSMPIPERGPLDVRQSIRAFNQMRTRLERFVSDRTQMLAAISHDLRTPVAALRVRAELIEDEQTRHRILATLDEMQEMVEATLAFSREDAQQEATRPVDLDALIQSLCDDLSDTGADVQFEGPGKTPYRCRSVSLKRALRNLIENAVRYGLRARVSLNNERDSLTVRIEDDGPGIAREDQQRIFEPFVRLETSRNRATGGVGLGLSIARTVIHSHGGEISITNRAQGGLRVTVVLPKPK